MNIKERKKEISKKLNYLGYTDKQIKVLLKTNYNLRSRISKDYLDFEKRVNNYHEIVKCRKNTKKGKLEEITTS